MVDSVITQLEDLRHTWSRAVTSLVWGHWLMLDTGFQATERILATAVPGSGPAPPRSAPPMPVEKGGLKALALARARQGLAPPREVYLAPYRDQIDWAEFPEWARPSNPDLFEGCSHEG
jgi:hypothetical protein